MSALRRILVPLDGSPLSEKALPLATQLAERFESELVLLRALDVILPGVGASYPERHWIYDAQQYNFHEAENYLKLHAAELTQQGLRVQTLVQNGPPPQMILDMAAEQQIDLIVISSHGEGGRARWTSGSVADKVMQHSPCPVLLIREPPATA
jgi:nucleotide-binding universal stress UspA family protein